MYYTGFTYAGRILKIFLICYILISFYSCEKDKNPVDNIPPCPGIDIVSISPYSDPVWHPNGNLIGFNYTPLDSITYPYGEHCQGEYHSNRDSAGFWLINSDGTNQHRILPFFLYVPAWSFDGNWIAFVKGNQIFKMPFNGSGFDTTNMIQLTNTGNNFFPTWSPDGNWIAFDSGFNSPNGMNFIWKIKSTGFTKTRIAYTPDKGEVRMPNWSYDGIKIFHIRYSVDYSSSAPEICSMDQNGNNYKRLTFNNIRDYYPVISPQGNLISFIQSGKNLGTNIALMDTSGANFRKLTNGGVYGSGIAHSWSPDGNNIVYVKYKYDDWSLENGTIWIININSGEREQLTYNP